MKRTLHLKRERLAELAGPQLASVVGGTHITCGATDACTHNCATVDVCRTLPVNPCLTIGGCVTGVLCVETR